MTDAADVPDSRTDRPPARHLLAISGTGRTGTSFLVRYLAGLGLDTELSRNGNAEWNEQANAGFETLPIVTPADKLPYVIKTPWMSEFIDAVLAQPDLALDAAIIPMRDLVEAATSRVILEMRAIHASSPAITAFDRMHESWGHTPGGLIYSLNPIDQARILAVGFHRLIQRLVEADVPIVFLGFPRLVADSDYVFTKLRAFLPAHITREAAHAVHHAVADIRKVRVGDELASDESGATLTPGFNSIKFPEHDKLDRIAIRRELKRLRQEEQALRADLERHKAEIARMREKIARAPWRRLLGLVAGKLPKR